MGLCVKCDEKSVWNDMCSDCLSEHEEAMMQCRKPKTVNIKYHTLEHCTIPDAWKVWIVLGENNDLECAAIFKDNETAWQFVNNLKAEGIVTRSSTIMINNEEKR